MYWGQVWESFNRAPPKTQYIWMLKSKYTVCKKMQESGTIFWNMTFTNSFKNSLWRSCICFDFERKITRTNDVKSLGRVFLRIKIFWLWWKSSLFFYTSWLTWGEYQTLDIKMTQYQTRVNCLAWIESPIHQGQIYRDVDYPIHKVWSCETKLIISYSNFKISWNRFQKF